ncbi:MAG: flagellar assembly protein A [Desulfotomaculales bacterium]
MNGKAWVQDGRIRVRNPVEGGKPAVVAPGRGVRLFVNGEEVTQPRPVLEEDDLRIETLTERVPGETKVYLSPDGLEAFMEVKLDTIVSYDLADQSPRENLVLEATPRYKASCPYNYEQVVALLAEAGVRYGILREAVEAFLARPEDGRFLVARGKAPTPPVDERIDILFPERSTGKPIVREDGRVDFYELDKFFSVGPGTVLARKHPAVPGQPGKSVTGEEIAPQPPRTIEIITGQGTDLAGGGLQVIATGEGRPTVSRSQNTYRFEVIPSLVCEGDVDLSTGNIRFKGDVKVTGSVTHGTTVQATGKIEILGAVLESTVDGGGDVIVQGNIIASTIRAGGDRTHLEKFAVPLEELLRSLMPAVVAARQLVVQAGQGRRRIEPGQALMLLFDRKYPEIPVLIKKVLNLYREVRSGFDLPGNLANLVAQIEQSFTGVNLLRLNDFKVLASFLTELRNVVTELKEMAGVRANISVPYAVNSTLEAAGDVVVTGQGCYGVTIHAGGTIRVTGVFRGGEAYGKKGIIVGEAGSEMGIRTTLRTGAGGKVEIGKAHPGVVVQVGARSTEFTVPLRNVKAALDPEESSVAVDALKWERPPRGTST